MDVDDVAAMMDKIGSGIDQFKLRHTQQLDDIERKVNAFRLGAMPGSVMNYQPGEIKAMAAGIRALIRGDHGEATKHFKDAHSESKGMIVGSDVEGGFFVTSTFSIETTRLMIEIAPFIPQARTVFLPTGDAFEEIEDLEEAGSDWVGEVQARPDTTTPKVGKLTIQLHELYAMPKASQKLLDTADIDLISWLQSKVAEKYAHREVDSFLNGNGVTRPRGFLTYITAATGDATRAWGQLEHVVTGANGAFLGTTAAPDCLVDVISKLKSQFRRGAVWLMNRVTQAMVHKLKDTQGRFLLVDSLIEGQPNQLLGHSVIDCEQMPDPATGSLSIAFGNFKKGYTIARKPGDRLLVDPYTDKPNVKLYSYRRVGGQVNNFHAIKLLKFST